MCSCNVLELDGRDLRTQSWDTRRALLTQLLDRCQDGLRLSEHVEERAARSYSGRHVSWEPRPSRLRASDAHRFEQTHRFGIAVPRQERRL
jgi:hypothetical protein